MIALCTPRQVIPRGIEFRLGFVDIGLKLRKGEVHSWRLRKGDRCEKHGQVLRWAERTTVGYLKNQRECRLTAC